jgi:WD40 repeat protein
MDTHELVRKLDGYGITAEYTGLCADGRHVVTQLGAFPPSSRSRLYWDLDTGSEIAQFHFSHFSGHDIGIASLAVSADEQYFATGGASDHSCRVWDAKTGDIVHEFFNFRGHSVTAISFSPDGERLVAGCEEGTVCEFSLKSGERLGQHILESPIHAVAFSEDGEQIYVGTEHGALLLESP